MALAVKTNQLTKTYNNTPCVNNVDLRIPEGSIYGFLGPNGAGKSTTMKMLLGLIKCSGGTVEVLGQTMNDKTAWQSSGTRARSLNPLPITPTSRDGKT